MLINRKKIWTPDNSYLLEYIERCECGEYIIGEELRQELNNLKRDFKDERFFYDTETANLRMAFMEGCVRLTKSPFYNQPMILMLWQKAFIETIYSFKMTEESKEKGILIDRFKKILLLIARKNTKSETCSGLMLSEFETGNAGADLVCSSNDDNQASITYDAVDLMRMLIDPHDLDTKRNQRHILNKVSNSKIFKLSDRTRNKEGRNIDFAILDESHEMKTNVIAKSIEQSQSLKDNPKFINITTEGFIENGYLDGELERARKIIRGEAEGIAAIRFLPWLYTQDCEEEIWQDRNSWQKSNPTLGIVKKWSYLDEQVDLAKESKADRIFVLSKDFNIKQNAAEAWLNPSSYKYSARFDIEDFKGAAALGAVDLSETTDLTCAKILLMKPDGREKYIHTMYFIPESKLDSSDDYESGARYKEWAEKGLMTITEGNDIDLAIVAQWFYELYAEYEIRTWKVGYDQKFSRAWLSQMGEYGWTKENDDLILIQQNAVTLDNAIRLLEAELKQHLINYNENAVDQWCLKNACLKIDSYGKALCVKPTQTKRIDGAVTKIILMEMYRRYRTEFKKLVEE